MTRRRFHESTQGGKRRAVERPLPWLAPYWSAMPARSLRWPPLEELGQDCRIFLPRPMRGARGWACTTLAIKPNFPLTPGLFDLVIVDEASQCGLAAVLPAAYRAKRPRRCRGSEPTEPDRVDRTTGAWTGSPSARISPRGTPGGPTGRWHRVRVHGFRSCRRR